MRNNNQWTEARFNSFIKSSLRSGSVRWPPRFQALANSYVGKKQNKSTGRVAKHYLCAHCKEEFPASKVQVDHINPVIDPYKGFVSWDEVINRMFCEVEGLQILCLLCHKEKTNKEKQIAKERNVQGI